MEKLKPLKLKLLRDGFDNSGAAEWCVIENGTTFIGEVFDRNRMDYNWEFGLCPECNKYDGLFSINKLNFAFCLEHRLAWCHTIGKWDILEDWYTSKVAEQNTEFLCRNFRQAEGWEKCGFWEDA
jgi:hypothetical protein